MTAFDLICYIIAAVLFALAAIAPTRVSDPAQARVNLVALGLLAWVLVPLVNTVQALH